MGYLDLYEEVQADFCRKWSEKLSKALAVNEVNKKDEKAKNNGDTNRIKVELEFYQLSFKQKPQNNGGSNEGQTTGSSGKTEGGEGEEDGKQRVHIEFDWSSFTGLFTRRMRDQGQEGVNVLIAQLTNDEGGVAVLLKNLLKKLTKDTDYYNEEIKAYLQQKLKKYIIRYSDDYKSVGHFIDEKGEMVDIVQLIGDNDWHFRDISQSIEKCSKFQVFSVDSYRIKWQNAIKHLMGKDITIDIDWQSIDYAAMNFSKAVETVYFDQSTYVCEEIFRAFEWIATYEDDELVDAVSEGINCIQVCLQPGYDAFKKDFDFIEADRCIVLRLCLEADNFEGVFRYREMVQIVKYCGLYNSPYTIMFKSELLAAAATLFKVCQGDPSAFVDLVTKGKLYWQASEIDKEWIDACKDRIAQLYREKFKKDRAKTNANGSNAKTENGNKSGEGRSNDDDDDEPPTKEFEKYIKAWHIVKYNKRNMKQERILFLTEQAYWTFKFDFAKRKLNEGHFKRHDLLQFVCAEVGELSWKNDEILSAVKIHTREKRKRDFLGRLPKEIVADPQKITPGRRISRALSKRFSRGARTRQSYANLYSVFDESAEIRKMQARKNRTKLKKADREKPDLSKCYSSVFIPCDQAMETDTRKDFVIEIAWSIYAMAAAKQRSRGCEPFINNVLKRPKGDLTSYLYNKLRMGLISKKSDHGSPSSPRLSLSPLSVNLTRSSSPGSPQSRTKSSQSNKSVSFDEGNLCRVKYYDIQTDTQDLGTSLGSSIGSSFDEIDSFDGNQLLDAASSPNNQQLMFDTDDMGQSLSDISVEHIPTTTTANTGSSGGSTSSNNNVNNNNNTNNGGVSAMHPRAAQILEFLTVDDNCDSSDTSFDLPDDLEEFHNLHHMQELDADWNESSSSCSSLSPPNVSGVGVHDTNGSIGSVGSIGSPLVESSTAITTTEIITSSPVSDTAQGN